MHFTWQSKIAWIAKSLSVKAALSLYKSSWLAFRCFNRAHAGHTKNVLVLMAQGRLFRLRQSSNHQQLRSNSQIVSRNLSDVSRAHQSSSEIIASNSWSVLLSSTTHKDSHLLINWQSNNQLIHVHCRPQRQSSSQISRIKHFKGRWW